MDIKYPRSTILHTKVCTSVDVISSAPLDKNGKSDLQFKPLSDQYFFTEIFFKGKLVNGYNIINL